jgi:hypothetical protein
MTVRSLGQRIASVVRHRLLVIKPLWHARGGAPAIEFALLAPVMAVLLTGSYDVTQLLIAQRQVTTAAQEIAEIATELSVQRDQSTSLTIDQAYQAQTAVYGMMPALKSGRDTNAFSVTLSAVVFIAIPAGCLSGENCTYVGNIAWSVALPQGLQVTRPCGVVAQTKPTQQATINDLPTSGMTSMTSMVVADVSYIYQPLFTRFIGGSITLRRTALMPSRSGKLSKYTLYDIASNGANRSVCEGFL